MVAPVGAAIWIWRLPLIWISDDDFVVFPVPVAELSVLTTVVGEFVLPPRPKANWNLGKDPPVM